MRQSSFHVGSFRSTLLGFVLVGGATLYSCAPKGSSAEKNAESVAPSSSVKPPEKKLITSTPAKPALPEFKLPDEVKGLYLTAWSAGSTKKLNSIIGMIDRTELNAVVIDVRDTGEMYFKTGIKLAEEAKANEIAVVKPQVLMQTLAKHEIWPIARIACFRDQRVPKHFVERAVQVSGGKPWKDRSGHMWLDPYQKRNWDYIAATVDYAMDIGFPEIQLDYVRFPSEGKAGTQVFPGKASYTDPKAKPEDVIAEFAKYIGERVRKRGKRYSADIFGIISSSKKDQGIGQELEKVAEPFDLVSPMVYPSHFAKGEYGIKNPDAAPYEIVKKSLNDYKKRIPTKEIRPWLQDFSLGQHYGAEQVKAQIKASREIGYKGFLLWNAGNRYTESALAKDTPPVLHPETK